jgi:predicted adenine nucleotide alpha hydrolase (AANH) superfamily ATPase
VDSHYFLKRLREALPLEPLIGFFYNPNIHPYDEYRLRLFDVRRSCEKYGIKLIEGEYDVQNWCEAVKGLECEKERGARCEVCFEKRLEVTAKKAKELGEERITTTLFMSPKKSFAQLEEAAAATAKKEGVEVLCFDFRKGGGSGEQFKLAREERLYHQNYCGCMYALSNQREAQKRPLDEMMSPIGRDILPCCIQERLGLYEKVVECEKNAQRFDIERQKFQNYRLLWGRVSENDHTIGSYFLSEIEGGVFEYEVSDVNGGFGFTKERAVFLDIGALNKLAKSGYKSVKELIFEPLVRQKRLDICKELADFSPIVVLDDVKKTTYKIECRATFYQDIIEVLAIL